MNKCSIYVALGLTLLFQHGSQAQIFMPHETPFCIPQLSGNDLLRETETGKYSGVFAIAQTTYKPFIYKLPLPIPDLSDDVLLEQLIAAQQNIRSGRSDFKELRKPYLLLRQLERKKLIVALPYLHKIIDYRFFSSDNEMEPSLRKLFPAMGALIGIGEPSMPFVWDGLTAEYADDDIRKDLYNTILYKVKKIKSPQELEFHVSLERYALDQEAYKLRYYAQNIPDLEEAVKAIKVEVAPVQAPSPEALAQALVKLEPSAEPKVSPKEIATAINALGELRAGETVFALIPYLAFKGDETAWPPQTVALSQGNGEDGNDNGTPATFETAPILTPATTALIKIGRPALEPLATAMASEGATSTSRTQAMVAIIAITGSVEAAQKTLLDAANRADKKSEILRQKYLQPQEGN